MKLALLTLLGQVAAYRNCKERHSAGITFGGLVAITPAPGTRRVVYCGAAGESSIFTVDGDITLGEAACYDPGDRLATNSTSSTIDDSDSTIMWEDLTLFAMNKNGDDYGYDYFQNMSFWNVGRDGEMTGADGSPLNSSNLPTLIPNLPTLTAKFPKPLVFPAPGRTVFLDGDRLVWKGNGETLIEVNVSSTIVAANFTTIEGTPCDWDWMASFVLSTDGVDMASLASLDNVTFAKVSFLLEFNFVTDTVQITEKPFVEALGSYLDDAGVDEIEEDAFAQQLWTVNGKVVLLKTSENAAGGNWTSIFQSLGPIQDMDQAAANVSATVLAFDEDSDVGQIIGDAGWGLDLFGYVDTSDFLHMADWSHDGGSFFACESYQNRGDQMLGTAPSNIKLTFNMEPTPISAANLANVVGLFPPPVELSCADCEEKVISVGFTLDPELSVSKLAEVETAACSLLTACSLDKVSNRRRLLASANYALRFEAAFENDYELSAVGDFVGPLVSAVLGELGLDVVMSDVAVTAANITASPVVSEFAFSAAPAQVAAGFVAFAAATFV